MVLTATMEEMKQQVSAAAFGLQICPFYCRQTIFENLSVSTNESSGQKGIKCLWYSYTFVIVLLSLFVIAQAAAAGRLDLADP